jgi:hypothetical protein
LFLAVFDSGNAEDVVPNKHRIRIMDGLLDKVDGQAPYEAQKSGNALALGIEMLGDLGVGAGRICFEIIVVLDGLG